VTDAPKTDHAYDGIEEYDNPLPGWWKWLFIATIAFCPFYWLYFHGGAAGRSVEDRYSVALAESSRRQFAEIGDLEANEATILRYMTKDSWLSVGKSVFLANCISCHGREGQGEVGPNLTDDYYKNVRSVEDIAQVLKNGAGGGAMPAWSNRLHPNEIVLVAAYVANLRGNEVEGGRIPEGREIPPWPEPPPEPEPESDEAAESDAEADAPAAAEAA